MNFLLLVLNCFFLSIPAPAQMDTVDERRVENIVLKDLSGKDFSLMPGDGNAVVAIAYASGCPIFQKTVSEILALQEAYTKKNIHFYLIGTNSAEKPDALKKELSKYALGKITFLLDPEKKAIHHLGLTRTAETVLIDGAKKEKIYQGAITDRFGYGSVKMKKDTHFLDEAVKSYLKGEGIKIPFTETRGCLISL